MNIRSSIAILLFSLSAVVTHAQQSDTTYFDACWNTSAKAQSSYYRITKTIEKGKKYEVADYYNSGKLQMTGSYISLSPEIKDGIFTWYNKDGEKDSETVFENGKVKNKRYFGTNPDGKPSPELISLEKQPEYPGGMKKLYKYIGDNFNYPKNLKPRPKGKIILSFVIDKDGSIKEVYAHNSLHPLLDAEAIRVIENMPKWEPGIKCNKPVRVIFTIPLAMN